MTAPYKIGVMSRLAAILMLYRDYPRFKVVSKTDYSIGLASSTAPALNVQLQSRNDAIAKLGKKDVKKDGKKKASLHHLS